MRFFSGNQMTPLSRERLSAAVLACLVCIPAGYIAASLNSYMVWNITEMSLVVLLVGLVFIPITAGIYSNQLDVFEPIHMFAFTFLIAFGLGTLALLLQDDRIMIGGVNYRPVLAKALLVAVIGLSGSYTGYAYGRHSLSESVLPRFKRLLGLEPPSGTVFYLSLIALISSGLLYYLWLRIANIPFVYLNTLSDDVTYGQATKMARINIYYLWMFRLSWPLLILLTWSYAPNRFWKLVLALVWLVNLILFIMGGNRSNLFSLLGAGLIAYYLGRQTRPSFLSASLLLTLVIFGVGAMVLIRGYTSPSETLETSSVLKAAAEEITERGTATGLIASVHVFPEIADFIGFSAISDLFYAPIPRVLWPDKPPVIPAQLVINYHVPRAHAPGVLGVYFAGFGLVGPFVILFFYGALSAIIYEAWKQEPRNVFYQIVLAGWIPLIWVIIHRGPPSLFLIRSMYIFGPIFLVRYMAGRLSTRRSEMNRGDRVTSRYALKAR